MNRYLCAFVILALCTCSCVKRDKEPCINTMPIVEAEINSSTKTSFDPQDRIGIYPVGYINGVAGILGDVAYPLNIEYSYNGSFWSPVSYDEITLNTTLMDIYAYFPYDPQLSAVPGKLDVGAYPFDISGDQSLKECDFLWAKNTGLDATETRAVLIFNHVLCHLRINIQFEAAIPENIELSIHNTFTTPLISLRDGTSTRGTEKEIIYATRADEAQDEYDVSYTAIVSPQLISSGTPLLLIESEDDYQVLNLQGDLNLIAGRSYTINVISGTALPEI